MTVTYPGSSNDIQALLPVFRILIRILAPDKDFDRNLTTLKGFEMLGCAYNVRSNRAENASSPNMGVIPFFAVVTI